LTGQTGYSSNLKKLGFELGKLIYVYDGLLDFQNDSKAGIFNCLSACYLNQDKDIRRISIEIFDFIENTRNNISSVLKNIEFENNDDLIKRIFLQDFEIREINHKQNISYIFKGMKSTCGTRITLSKQTIYDIMIGKLSMKMIQDERANSQDLCTSILGALSGTICCCVLPYACILRAKKDKKYNESIKRMSTEELIREDLLRRNRRY
jgi:hypothetical protein